MKKRQAARYGQQSFKQSDKDLLIKKCTSMIEQLQLELESANKINEEQKHLIEILKEGKDYYEHQYKLNIFQHQFVKLQQENQRLQSLAKVQQSSSEEMKIKVDRLAGQKAELEAILRQKDQRIAQKEEKYLKILLEKQILEKEWNKVVKAVKKKINLLVSTTNINPEISRRRVQSSEKGIANSQEGKRIPNPSVLAHFGIQGKTLQKRAQNMVRFIDNMLAAQQLENMLSGGSSDKKAGTKLQLNSERKPLREMDWNRVQLPLNVGFQ